ncbi:MAG: hypothetical protein ATN34_03900 [Epulopiscium sp. Nele67-Bin002]|nr:MAG: hypothetical protein ATN34_03900 [Epulopiscium sp. Nele67-Bin002]
MKISLKEYRLPMFITYLLTTIYYSVCCYFIQNSSVVNYPLEVWHWGGEYVTYFLPLIAVAPFSFVLYAKLKEGFINYASIRKSRRLIMTKEIVQAMLAASITVFCIFVTVLILVLSFSEPNATNNNLQNYPFGEMQVNSPMLFGVIWSAWLAFASSLFILFSSLLATNLDNYFVITLLPFAYFHCENLVTALLRIPQISLATSITLNRLKPSAMTNYIYVIGIVSFIIVIVVTNIGLKYRKGLLYDNY